MSKHKVFETLERITQKNQRLTAFDADLVNRIEAGVANDPQQSRAIRDIKQRLQQMAMTAAETAILPSSPSPSFFRQEFQAVPPAATTSPEPNYGELMRIAYQERYDRDQAQIERSRRDRRGRGVVLSPDEPPATPSTIVEAAAPEPAPPSVQGSSASAERPRRRILTKRISTDEISVEPRVRDDAGR
jgi:hypothetical protein